MEFYIIEVLQSLTEIIIPDAKIVLSFLRGSCYVVSWALFKEVLVSENVMRKGAHSLFPPQWIFTDCTGAQTSQGEHHQHFRIPSLTQAPPRNSWSPRQLLHLESSTARPARSCRPYRGDRAHTLSTMWVPSIPPTAVVTSGSVLSALICCENQQFIHMALHGPLCLIPLWVATTVLLPWMFQDTPSVLPNKRRRLVSCLPSGASRCPSFIWSSSFPGKESAATLSAGNGI